MYYHEEKRNLFIDEFIVSLHKFEIIVIKYYPILTINKFYFKRT